MQLKSDNKKRREKACNTYNLIGLLIFLCNHASFIRNLRTAQTILMDFRFEIVI